MGIYCYLFLIHAGETSENLLHRIGSCPRIYQGRLVRGEDIGAPHKGKSSHSVRVIAYGQLQEDGQEQEKGPHCLLPDYPKVGVPHSMRVCEQWPAVLQELSNYVWCLTKPYLGEYSFRRAPNHCEVRFHYVCAGTTVSRHRDFFRCCDLLHYFQHGMYPEDKGTGAQAAKSDVIVFTMSNIPMTYALSFPQGTSRHAVMCRDSYVSHPAFQCMLEDGNVTVQRTRDGRMTCSTVTSSAFLIQLSTSFMAGVSLSLFAQLEDQLTFTLISQICVWRPSAF